MAMKMAMAGNVQARLPAAYQGQPGWAPTRSRSQNILTEIIEMIYTGNPGPDTRGHAPMSDDALCVEYNLRTIKRQLPQLTKRAAGLSSALKEIGQAKDLKY